MQEARGAPLSGADTPNGATAVAPRPPRRRAGVLLAVALVAYVLDQVTKALAVEHLTGRPPVQLVGELLQLRLHRNPGAAFGLAEGATVLLAMVAVAVVVAILWTARNLRSGLWALSLGLLLGGALGNLTDRLVRPPEPLRGHVIDFLELPNWPIFNVADMAIVGGASLAVLLTLLGRSLDGTRADEAPAAEDARG